MSSSESKQILTAKEVAEILRISYWLVIKLAKQKKIPNFKLGTRVLFRKEALEKYIESIEEKIQN